jgi:hypothetical protein
MSLVDLTTDMLEQHWAPFTANRGFKRAPRHIAREREVVPPGSRDALANY